MLGDGGSEGKGSKHADAQTLVQESMWRVP